MISLKLTLFILFIGLITANSHLNIKYRDILNGNKQLTHELAKEIYSDFRSPYHEKSEYRFELFYRRLVRIVNHNKDKTKSWQKGVTIFTDMTFE